MGLLMDADVLVVGAGPTGLMLACQLARRGLKPVIVDRHSGPAQQSRAMAVQARTLEIYSMMGVANEAIAAGAIGASANMWANGRWSARIPLGDIGQALSPYPFVLMLGQDENERLLGALLESLGVSIRWDTEVVALEQQETHVDATLKLPDGSTTLAKAKWVGGCDGSRSAVRDLTGIAFPGAAYEHVFFVADTTATGSMKKGDLNVFLWSKGFHLFFPMRGDNRWRVIGILPQHLREKNGVSFSDVVPELQQEAGRDLTFPVCHWFSTYRIHHRAAERFRDRRCFLLGDAAHVHSPMGGQGMNTGLQDAYNLAWKLALVAQGRAEPRLLDSYEAERVPVARRLLQTTDRAFQLIVADSWLARVFRTRIMARIVAAAMGLQCTRETAFRAISQIGIAYRDSSLSMARETMPASAPQAGDRFPLFAVRDALSDATISLKDTHFNLLLFGPSGAPADLEPFGDLVAVREARADDAAAAKHGIPSTAFYLLRPDGHVGLCGVHCDAFVVGRYLRETMCLTP